MQVELQIGERTAEESIPVTIHVLMPRTWTEDGTWGKLTLIQQPATNWRPSITVRGPERMVEKLKQGPDQVRAYLVLTEADKKPIESWLPPRAIEIHLPALFQDKVEIVGDPPKVTFKLEPRVSAAPTP